MKRTHISRGGELTVLKGRLPSKGEAIKPDGFWYEVDGDWRRWCESEMPQWMEGLLYEVTISPNVRLLRITSLTEFDAFHREYVTVEPYPGARTLYPDWTRLAAQYDGIEIAPYQWDRRMTFETFWYYGWDCASGCLWTPRDTTITLLGEIKPPVEQPA